MGTTATVTCKSGYNAQPGKDQYVCKAGTDGTMAFKGTVSCVADGCPALAMGTGFLSAACTDAADKKAATN